MVCFKINITKGSMTNEDVNLFLNAGKLVDKKMMKPKPTSSWFPDSKAVWDNILAIANHNFGGKAVKIFEGLPESMVNSPNDWATFFNS